MCRLSEHSTRICLQACRRMSGLLRMMAVMGASARQASPGISSILAAIPPSARQAPRPPPPPSPTQAVTPFQCLIASVFACQDAVSISNVCMASVTWHLGNTLWQGRPLSPSLPPTSPPHPSCSTFPMPSFLDCVSLMPICGQHLLNACMASVSWHLVDFGGDTPFGKVGPLKPTKA